eukprot:356348-Chlamydomonas_euryale.AAC.26
MAGAVSLDMHALAGHPNHGDRCCTKIMSQCCTGRMMSGGGWAWSYIGGNGYALVATALRWWSWLHSGGHGRKAAKPRCPTTPVGPCRKRPTDRVAAEHNQIPVPMGGARRLPHGLHGGLWHRPDVLLLQLVRHAAKAIWHAVRRT